MGVLLVVLREKLPDLIALRSMALCLNGKTKAGWRIPEPMTAFLPAKAPSARLHQCFELDKGKARRIGSRLFQEFLPSHLSNYMQLHMFAQRSMSVARRLYGLPRFRPKIHSL